MQFIRLAAKPVARGFIPVGSRSGPSSSSEKAGPATQSSGDKSPRHKVFFSPWGLGVSADNGSVISPPPSRKVHLVTLIPSAT